MSKEAQRKAKHWRAVGATVGFILGVGMVATAQARGIVADQTTPAIVYGGSPNDVILSSPVCALNMTCNAINKADLNAVENFEFNEPSPAAPPIGFGFPPVKSPVTLTDMAQPIYVYNDGIIGIGSALTGAQVGNLGSLSGQNYIAAGFNDYSGTNMKVGYDVRAPNQLIIYWIFSPPNVSGTALFGIDLQSQSDGSIDAHVDYGADMSNWFTGGYCPAACDPASGGDDIGGVFSLSNTLAGSSYAITGGDVNFPDGFTVVIPAGSQTTVSVPEPSTWSVLTFGIGAMVVVTGRLRWRRKAKTC